MFRTIESAKLYSEIDYESPRTGCVGEFATFGFLTFLITILNTIINLGKI